MNTKKLFSFEGRIGRASFWGLSIGGLVPYAVGFALLDGNPGVLRVLLGIVVVIASFISMLATSVKRWHDRNKSGAWVFINIIPIIGGIWALIEQGFLSGTYEANSYGPPSSGSPFA